MQAGMAVWSCATSTPSSSSSSSASSIHSTDPSRRGSGNLDVHQQHQQ
jgi:hypothetical protein